MDGDERDYRAEVEASKADLGADRMRAVCRLRAAEEAWARALARVDPSEALVVAVRAAVSGGLPAAEARQAASHLAEAERWQWEIGTWATGSGEGLASMLQVRTLQLARAWLLSADAADDPAASGEALRLVQEVVSDPNDVAAGMSSDAEALRTLLGRAMR